MSKIINNKYSFVRVVAFRTRFPHLPAPVSVHAVSPPERGRSLRAGGRGFTLVEMIIVCALLAICATIAVPYFQILAGSTQVRGAVQTVTSDLQLTKMRSISLSKRCRLLFLSTSSYKLQSYNSGAALWEDIPSETVRDFSSNANPYYHQGVTITAPAGNEVVFQPWGTTAAVSLTVQNTEKQGAITVSPTGKVCSQVTDV